MVKEAVKLAWNLNMVVEPCRYRHWVRVSLGGVLSGEPVEAHCSRPVGHDGEHFLLLPPARLVEVEGV